MFCVLASHEAEPLQHVADTHGAVGGPQHAVDAVLDTGGIPALIPRS